MHDDEEGISYSLTRASLMYGRNITTPDLRYFEVISTNQSRLTQRWKYHKRTLNEFTDQWRKEYLTSLRESSISRNGDKGSKCAIIGVSDVVVLKSYKSARAFWNLARVEEPIPRKDGVIKVAKAPVVNSENSKLFYLPRPIQLLISLEAFRGTIDRRI